MYLGIDFGTSGCRATIIDDQARIQAEARHPLEPPVSINGRIEQDPGIWIDGLQALLQRIGTKTPLDKIKRLAIDGTSGTVLLTTPEGRPLTPALMYNDASSLDTVPIIREVCPDQNHIALNPSSGLAKAIQLSDTTTTEHYRIVTQADFISGYLSQRFNFSDEHNSLKLGYDPKARAWPEWIAQLVNMKSLPDVLPPGTDAACIDAEIADALGLPDNCRICAGSTDANAAFLATGAHSIGDAVTSLGSTLVLKILSEQPVSDSASGVYSHRLGNLWLAGGASNTGARILREFFDDEELKTLSLQIDPQKPSTLAYYPLASTGERFPEANPEKQPLLTPRPDSDVCFLLGLLESLARIEHQGYSRLQDLGAQPVRRIFTAGGGSKNPQWTAIRKRLMGISVLQAEHSEASYGSALLALRGLGDFTNTN